VAGAEDAVQMPPRPSERRVVLPGGGDQAVIREPDQDRIQRAGLEAELLSEVVAVTRPAGIVGQRIQHSEGLR
jgi:hypothetical protein